MIRMGWALALTSMWTLHPGPAEAETNAKVGVLVVEGQGAEARQTVAGVFEELRRRGTFGGGGHGL